MVKSLDYEKKSLYQLRVLAVDRANQGPVNTGTAAILVKVKDIEDQPPVFSAINPVTRIQENVPIGTVVLQGNLVVLFCSMSCFLKIVLIAVKAHDGDRGVNNPIRYSIVSKEPNNPFGIDENTGIIFSTKTLDREHAGNQENGAFILEIVATERSALRVSFYNTKTPCNSFKRIAD